MKRLSKKKVVGIALGIAVLIILIISGNKSRLNVGIRIFF